MLSIEGLREYGADVETGLMRCMGMEDFYLRMVRMIRNEEKFSMLEKALKENDLQSAFEAAHALKGVCGNLALTPLFEPVSELTELLRARTEMDYSEYCRTIMEAKETLDRMIDSL